MLCQRFPQGLLKLSQYRGRVEATVPTARKRQDVIRGDATHVCSARRGKGVVTVAVLVANLPVGTMNDDLGALVFRDVTRNASCLSLRRLNRRRRLIPRTLDGPTVLVRDNMLIFACHFEPFRASSASELVVILI